MIIRVICTEFCGGEASTFLTPRPPSYLRFAGEMMGGALLVWINFGDQYRGVRGDEKADTC